MMLLFLRPCCRYTAGAVKVVQNTTFPAGGDVSLLVASGTAALVLRIPSWMASPTVQVTVQATPGGVVQNVTGTAGTYLKLPPVQAGGTVTVSFPMQLRASVCVDR